MSDFAGRLQALRRQLQAENAAGAVLAGTDQMRYLTGWQEGGHERFVGLFVPTQGEPAFLVPAMNALQAQTTPAGISQVVGWEDATGWRNAAKALMQSWAANGLVLVDDELHSVHLLGLETLFPNAKFAAIGETMARLREIKTPEELDAMQRAATMIDEIFEESLGRLREGMAEAEFADLILNAIRRRDSRPSFSPLICFGSNSALPHHHTGSRKLQRGDIVIIDIGCLVDGYASDITRTVSYGAPSDPDAQGVYGIVSRAHWTARETAKPGVTGEAVDGAARNVITEAGHGPQFLHRTGHGIGLSTHEPPNIVKGNTAPLQPSMCFSVEPGIYLPGRFGVRIENIVTVTQDGVRSLNAEASRELRILMP
jgi:Xaa-Pro aminopeptidase